jgi:hypothetical protein
MTTLSAVIDVYEGMGPECEHTDTCPKGCYHYEYMYGVAEFYVQIRHHMLNFGWHYSDPDSVFRSQADAIEIAIQAAKQCQSEDFQNPVHGRDSGITS